VDTFEAEAQIDIEAVAQQIREIEQNMGAIDAKIADYCKQLGITSPFSVA
jgi:type I restriction enzyme M protein